jgi:oxalate decarboxylase/phosphoglucose isomerase-like protein (cupin superfamily)
MSAVYKVIHEQDVKQEKLEIGGRLKLLFSEKHVFLALGFFEPGESMKSHYHTEPEEIYYVLKGNGEVTVGDSKIEVKPGTAIYIPPGVAHWPKNTGNETLVIAFFHAPPETGKYLVLSEE